LKTAKDMKDKFPRAEAFFTNFTKMKTVFKDSTAEFFLRTLQADNEILSPHWEHAVGTPKVSLGVFDLRDTYYPACKGEEPARNCVKDHLERLKQLSKPSFNDPTVWVWIVNGPSKKLGKLKTQLQEFFSGYTMDHSLYRVAKAEKIYNLTALERSAHDVQLLFLFKDDVEGRKLRLINRPEYAAASVPYYQESGHFYEAKWRAKESELRMEFYINLIQVYCEKGDGTLGVFCGSKFMVASLVSTCRTSAETCILSDYPRTGDNSVHDIPGQMLIDFSLNYVYPRPGDNSGTMLFISYS